MRDNLPERADNDERQGRGGQAAPANSQQPLRPRSRCCCHVSTLHRLPPPELRTGALGYPAVTDAQVTRAIEMLLSCRGGESHALTTPPTSVPACYDGGARL